MFYPTDAELTEAESDARKAGCHNCGGAFRSEPATVDFLVCLCCGSILDLVKLLEASTEEAISAGETTQDNARNR